MALGLALLAACASASDGPTSVERDWWIMGTRLSVRVEAGDRATAVSASEAIYDAVRTADQRLSVWRSGTALSKLNAAPAEQLIPVPPPLAHDIELARACWEVTEGASIRSRRQSEDGGT